MHKMSSAFALPFLLATSVTAVPAQNFLLSVAYAAETAEEQARPVIEAYVNAVYKRDPAQLDRLLAPEFQVMRADGTTYDKQAYLASSLPVIEAPPQIEDLVVTASAELLVARYLLIAKQTRDGVAIEMAAPRLSVFRKDGDRYLLVAHSNFAALAR